VTVQLRITNQMMSQTLLADINRANAEVARTSQQVSSGNQMSEASDDPLAASQALRLRSTLAQTNATTDSVNTAQGWSTASETALSSIDDMVQRAHELIVSAGNGTLQTSDRQQIAGEMSQLLDQMKLTANAKYGDAYVFSGQKSDTAPYTAGSSDTYAGDNGAVTRSLGPGQSVQVNVTGSAIFGGTTGDGKLFDTMRQAIAHLTGGTAADVTALQTTDLAAINTNLDTVVGARATVGAVTDRATLAASRLQDVNLNLTSQLSGIQDTDMASAITKLTTQKTAYQAALSAGANIIQKSLMDFLAT
jgi:flagellar hook-associated protein 3 FlgL